MNSDQTPPFRYKSANAFPTTRWTVVLSLDGTTNAQQNEALEAFYRAYTPALDEFLKLRFGKSFDASTRSDVLHDFIVQKCLNGKIFRAADPDRGQFRSLLSKSLTNFALSKLRASGARQRGVGGITEELELSLAANETAGADAFEVAWAVQTIARVAEALEIFWLEREMTLTWRVFQMSTLGPLVDYAPMPTGEQLASELGVSLATAYRHRERALNAFRTEMRKSLADYLHDPKEVDAELDTLIAAVHQAPREVIADMCLHLLQRDRSDS